MNWFHHHQWTITGITPVRGYHLSSPERTWPATSVLQVCDCGEVRTSTLTGAWTLEQLQPIASDKEIAKKMGIKL
jgi:hypothetical protein